jgi:hypothetical protein
MHFLCALIVVYLSLISSSATHFNYLVEKVGFECTTGNNCFTYYEKFYNKTMRNEMNRKNFVGSYCAFEYSTLFYWFIRRYCYKRKYIFLLPSWWWSYLPINYFKAALSTISSINSFSQLVKSESKWLDNFLLTGY